MDFSIENKIPLDGNTLVSGSNLRGQFSDVYTYEGQDGAMFIKSPKKAFVIDKTRDSSDTQQQIFEQTLLLQDAYLELSGYANQWNVLEMGIRISICDTLFVPYEDTEAYRTLLIQKSVPGQLVSDFTGYGYSEYYNHDLYETLRNTLIEFNNFCGKQMRDSSGFRRCKTPLTKVSLIQKKQDSSFLRKLQPNRWRAFPDINHTNAAFDLLSKEIHIFDW